MSFCGQYFYKITTSFEQHLNAPILPGLATVGRFLSPAAEQTAVLYAGRVPPPAPCLACASSGHNVIIHNNNSNATVAKRSAKHGTKADSAVLTTAAVLAGEEEASFRVFNFGKEPTALAAAPLERPAAATVSSLQESLLFGAATSVLAYDVNENRQFFFKDVEDGVCALAAGVVKVGGNASDAPGDLARDGPTVLALVGGNCSVYGFDCQGAERFWTITGDQVTAMMLIPWESRYESAGDALHLVVASEDCEIRVFDGEEMVASIMEVDRVRQLVPLWKPSNPSSSGSSLVGRFAYLLDNGTIGVYQQTERLWRIKSRHTPVSAAFCDVDCDGVEELVIGYDNGCVEIRSDLRAGGGNMGGQVLYTEMCTSPVAAVLAEDYRQDGKAIPLVCTVDGTVRGLTLLEANLEDAEEVRDAHVLDALVQQRQLLETQLATLEKQLSLQENGLQDLTMPEEGLQLCHEVLTPWGSGKVEVVFFLRHAPSDAVIQSCILSADTTAFCSADASVCFFADRPCDRLVCPLDYVRALRTTVVARVSVGGACAENYQIYELTFVIPPFVIYQLPDVLARQNPSVQFPPFSPPDGFVRLLFREALRMEAIEAWMRRSFCIPDASPLLTVKDPTAPFLRIELLNTRGDGSLVVDVRNPAQGFKTITVGANLMEHCGDVVSLLDAEVQGGLVVGDANPVEVCCEFPAEMQRLQEVLLQVEKSSAVRAKLTTDMADVATTVKTLLISAEDARLLRDMVNLRKTYTALYDLDCELLGENMKRLNNFEELKAALKEVNAFIQKAGRLRLGAAKVEIVTACRNALKEQKFASLVELIRGESACMFDDQD